MKTVLNTHLILALSLFTVSSPAFAYLDPGTGSMLMSVIIGLVSTIYFAIRKLPSFVRSTFFKVTGKSKHIHGKHIVIYGESKNYWGTFKPLLEEFGKRNINVEYLTSSEDDPCFKADLPQSISCRYIGTGNHAFNILNFLEADVLVLTTPGIDVLQIRRSKGVKKYIHVLHSIGDAHYYKLYSFDYYDVILCNGEYQVKTFRALERIRGTQTKELPVVGCPYIDLLVNRYNKEKTTPQKNCVLVAPTWGKMGMLTRYGATVPKLLAEAGWNVILRPHPQSFISEIPLMEQIEKELSVYPNITWDRNADGFASLSKASVMVSDLSGVIFDYAFVFLRPVITLQDQLDPSGFEAFDIPHPRWNSEVVKDLGWSLKNSEIESISEIVRELTTNEKYVERIIEIRDNNIANFGMASKPIVDEILRIATSVNQ